MKKINKIIKWILIVALLLAVVVGIVWFSISSLVPPDKAKMQKCFQRDQKDLSIVVNYLSNLDYAFVSIDKSNIEDEVMFTGANTSYQKIEDTAVLKSLNRLLKTKKYIRVGKNDNTVYFEKWRFIEKDRGIAVPVNKENQPVVEFLIKSEPLSEIGWYYYEADYEEYRKR